MYSITVQMITETYEGTTSRSLPTFQVQAASEAEARRKARDIVCPEQGQRAAIVAVQL